MPFAVADSYQTMIEMLAGLVKLHLADLSGRFILARPDEQTLELVNALLEEEDDEWGERELTAELLGTYDFRQVA